MLDSVATRSHIAVYQQIENHVQFAIASGKLKGGDKLRSVRELSEKLKANSNTIAKAYRDLEVMGLLYTRRGLGVFIEIDVQSKCKEECTKKIVARFHEVVSEARALGVSKKKLSAALNVSFDLNVHPYGETPKSILAIAES